MGPQTAFVLVMATFVATMTYVSFHRVAAPSPRQDNHDNSAPSESPDGLAKH
jgi:hypothetical protein